MGARCAACVVFQTLPAWRPASIRGHPDSTSRARALTCGPVPPLFVRTLPLTRRPIPLPPPTDPSDRSSAPGRDETSPRVPPRRPRHPPREEALVASKGWLALGGVSPASSSEPLLTRGALGPGALPPPLPAPAVCMLVPGRPGSACPPRVCCVEESPGGASRRDTWRPATGETGSTGRSGAGRAPARGREAATQIYLFNPPRGPTPTRFPASLWLGTASPSS